MYRVFTVNFELEENEGYVDSGMLAIDQRVFDQVTDAWRKSFYNLRTTKDVVNHLAYNILQNHRKLSMLDGFGDLDDDMVCVMAYPVLDKFEIDSCELTSGETKHFLKKHKLE